MENMSLKTEGHIAWLTIDRPAALNALNSQTINELSRTLQGLEKTELRVLVITGAGKKAFVAGGDIREMSQMTPSEAWAFSMRGNEALHRLETAHFATIAAVNGFALGGGCELALACDLIYASERAFFGQPEVNLGVIPGFGGTQRLTRVVGAMMARDLVLTGRMINAQDALRIGLAAQVFPAEELRENVQRIAETIAQKGPLAVKRAKDVLAYGLDVSLEDGLRNEREGFAALFSSEDQKEGMQAFIEKRSPVFKRI